MDRIDPWGSQAFENYQNLFDEFGIEPFDKFRIEFPENRYIRRGIIFGHRDFGCVLKSIKEATPFVMITGLMPSGRFHFGHKMVVDQVIWYQSMGADVFICSADLEAYTVRGIDLTTSKETALNEYLANYIALGLDYKISNFWFQTDYKVPYYRFRDILSKKVTFNELRGIYGELSPGKIFSVITQVADILHTQLDEFGGPRPVIVPVGADQDPHIRLTRDLASRHHMQYKFLPPSSTYHKFMRGLQGGKMSSSDPKSFIALSDDPKEAIRKIMAAKTGGRATVDEQKKIGGLPEDCTVYDLFLYHLVDDDRELEDIYTNCKKGDRICGECKAICSDMIVKFLHKHQEKLEKAKKIVREHMK